MNHRGPGASRSPSVAAARAAARTSTPRIAPLISAAPDGPVARQATQGGPITLGDWTLLADEDGDLVAVHEPSGTRRVLATAPQPSEGDP